MPAIRRNVSILRALAQVSSIVPSTLSVEVASGASA